MRTLLAIPTPSGASGATALLLRDFNTPRAGAVPVVVVIVALFLTNVNALHRVLIDDETFGAGAERPALRVGAGAIFADFRIDGAFVHVFAHVRDHAEFVTVGAGAYEGTHHVLALTRRRTSTWSLRSEKRRIFKTASGCFRSLIVYKG